MKYAELFCKTNYSFLTGSSRPAELVETAATLGLHGIAITDRDGVYGMPKAYHQSKKHPELKFITGCELTFEDHPRMRLLARDRAAYGVMCRMISLSHLGTPAPGVLPPETLDGYRTYKEKGQAGLHWKTFLKLMETYPGSSGIFALPIDFTNSLDLTGSRESQMPQATSVAHGPADFGALKDLFGDRIALPLCRVIDGKDRARTERARELSSRYGIPIVAVNDVHYHSPVRRPLQDVMTSIREGTTLREAGTRLFSNGERFLKSPRQMARLFRDLPEAIAQTVEIADRCTFSTAELRYYYPSEWIPVGESSQGYLTRLTWEGARKKFPAGIPDRVAAQLKHELSLVERLGYADYFLTIWDIVEFARSKEILCQGRGSAANSAVCFVLGITAIDPIKMDLLFERFMSVERHEPPDIDVDFEADRREEVIQYIYAKYGRHRAGMVAAVITYRSRLSTREAAKVFEIPLEELVAAKEAAEAEEEAKEAAKEENEKTVAALVAKGISIRPPERLGGRELARAQEYGFSKNFSGGDSKLAPRGPGHRPIGQFPGQHPVASALFVNQAIAHSSPHGHVSQKYAVQKTPNPNPNVPEKPSTQHAHKVEMARKVVEQIYGFPRHLSIHSGGFTLSRDPLIETVPVEPARMENRTIVQWDKDDLDAIGLLKVDVLSLGMLTALKKTFDLLNAKQTPGLAPLGAPRKLGLDTLPGDDPATWKMIQEGDTIGVFQIESRAQMGMLPRLKPKEFYDLVVQVAIVRPGPIVGKMVHPYLQNRKHPENIVYPHPKLETILGRTYGVPIFQEQVMKMAIELAGFTPGESDELRRAIAAWRSQGSIEKVGQRLREGLLTSGLAPEFVERIFDQIRGFSEYGFPESHAASFAHLSWVSSYLKCHHPAEFTCSLINSQPMGFYSDHTLVDDAKRHGVTVLPIDPERSTWNCTIEEDAASKKPLLRLGFRMIRGMNEKEADRLVHDRKTHGPFKSLPDFVLRTRLRQNVLHQLAAANTFERFGLDRRTALWEVLALAGTETVFVDPAQAKPGQQLSLALCGISSGGASSSGASAGSASALPALAPDANSTSSPTLFNPMSEYEIIQADYRSYGASVHGHPMQAIRKLKKTLPRETIAEIRKSPNGRSVSVSGLMIVRQRPPTAKGTCFGALEDESGLLDMIFHREVFERFEELYWNTPFLTVQGTLQRDGDSISLIVRKMRPVFPDPKAEESQVVHGIAAPASRPTPLAMLGKA